MKKLFSFFTAVVLLFCFGATTVNAEVRELTKSEQKAIEKDSKNRAKELKKEGWRPLASTSTLEFQLVKYRTYLAQDEDNRISIVGISLGSNNKLGRDNAMSAGIANYAVRAKAQVIGKLKSVMSSDFNNVIKDEIDRFGAAYEAAVNVRISSLIKEHFVLIRDDKSGVNEYNVFMSLDETEAKQAREQALREARQQTELGDLTKVVEDFISEKVAEE